MQYRTLGNSNLKLSVLGLGCNNFGGRADVPTTQRVIHHALDVGVNHFDTADIYGGEGKSEDYMGQVIGDKRSKMILATKFGLPMAAGSGGSRSYVKTAIEASLKRLRTDYIDLYYLHKPDPKTPIEETLGALDELKKQGKIRWYANSNMTGAEIDAADAAAKKNNFTPFIAAQDELSLIKRGTERDRIPAMVRHGLGFIPYFPLASGLLTGKYKRNQPMPEGTRLSTAGRLADVFVNDTNLELTYKIGDF
ncbi:MAG: aldo/keto reductase, partial [Rhizomicrobium sp.]